MEQATKFGKILIDDDDYEKIKHKYSFKNSKRIRKIRIWHSLKTGQKYAYIKFKLRKKLLSRIVMGRECDGVVDHINGDTLDNRKSNLRICSIAENLKNRRVHKNNISGLKGVHFKNDKKRNKPWKAEITSDRVVYCLGYYKTKEEAALVYNKAALIYHKDFARLNIL